MTLISCCPLQNYILTFKWALFVRILAGVRMFNYEAITTSDYKCLQLSTSFLNQIIIKKYTQL